jgi:hypothetical protein
MRFLFLLIFLSSCAGYRFQESKNPFAQYGIDSISIPMFYNHSNLTNISSPMTNEIYIMMTKFKDLKVKSGYKKADAVLIGIITSNRKLSQSRTGSNLRSVKNAADELIGDNRGDFYIPSNTTVSAKLRLILIKNPSDKEIKLMKSSLGKFVVSSKVIFNESIRVDQTFTRELYTDASVVVVNTQNRSAVKKSIDDMAKSAAQNFKDMIIYAF